MVERKKVIAKLKSWEKESGLLEAEGITPDIHLNKSILTQKKCTNTTPKIGDEFEVEIEPSTYNKKPSWKIINIRAIERKKSFENFAIKINKKRLFGFEEKKNEQKKTLAFQKLSDTFNQVVSGSENDIIGEDICKREKKIAALLTNSQIEVQTFKPDWRLIVGLGGGSVFETGITLHHIYGFPYIPASSIKGVLRSYLITQYFDNNEAKAFQNKLMCDIFGCPEEIEKTKTHYKKEQQGKIIFFDAMPLAKSLKGCITLDIMNPHYSEYYSGDKPPEDWHNPIPIVFLTVEKLSFQFIVGLPRHIQNKEEAFFGGNTEPLLKGVSHLLTEALQNRGIGAKTAVGYGYMKS
jgi:CRISPR-associated protein Cmr6